MGSVRLGRTRARHSEQYQVEAQGRGAVQGVRAELIRCLVSLQITLK